ncbi:MAG: hypothetical protein GX123_09325 [Clostridiales bacterium]|nr:hypothetical protein [Clostridiales bacterium]
MNAKGDARRALRDNAPQTLKFLQFGDGAALRPLIDDWIDRANAYEMADMGGIAIVDVKNEDQEKLLLNQGWYILSTTGLGGSGKGKQEKIVQCLMDVYPADDWQKVLQLAQESQLEFILTDASDTPAVPSKNDNYDNPKSLAGKVAAFLHARFESGESGVSILCCEPFLANGFLLHKTVVALAFAWELDSDFFKWLEEENVFLSTRGFRESALTYYAANEEEAKKPQHHAVLAEGYGLWLVEGFEFPESLTPLKRSGADIRVLQNYGEIASLHESIWQISTLLVGILCDALALESPNALMGDEDSRAFLAQMMVQEVAPAAISSTKDALEVVASSFERLENAYFGGVDRLKIGPVLAVWKNRLLPLIKACAAKELSCVKLIAASAVLFMELIAANPEEQKELHALSCDMEPSILAYALLSDHELWGEDLRAIPGFEEKLERAITDLQIVGIRAGIRSVVAQEDHL